jgi:hypothetical protein
MNCPAYKIPFLFLSVAYMARTIVEIISREALPNDKDTDNVVSDCPFFWAIAHFSGR